MEGKFMKINVYAFVISGDKLDVQLFANDQTLAVRMLSEMGDAGSGEEPLSLVRVADAFRNWLLSDNCQPGRRYEWQSVQLEIPVSVVVGMEGGVFLGASATAAGISILPFD